MAPGIPAQRCRSLRSPLVLPLSARHCATTAARLYPVGANAHGAIDNSRKPWKRFGSPAKCSGSDVGYNSNLETQDSKPACVPWGAAEAFQVLAVWILAYAMLGCMQWVPILHGLGLPIDLDGDRAVAVQIVVSSLASMTSTFAILWWALARHRPLANNLFSFSWPTRWRWLAWFLMIIPVYCCCMLDAPNAVCTDPYTYAMWIMEFVIIAPFWEEVFFRGFLYRTLHKFFPRSFPSLISGVLFALAHQNPAFFVPLTVLSGTWAMAYTGTGSLLVPIMLHAGWNACLVLIKFNLSS